MFTNPYFVETLAREHIRDVQREAEQNRLSSRPRSRSQSARWLVIAAALLLVGGFLAGLL